MAKEKEGVIYKRKKIYIGRIYKQKDYVQELKTSNLAPKMMLEYDANQRDTEKFLKACNKKIWFLNFLQVYLSGYFIVDFLIIIYLGYHIIVTKTIEGGDLLAVFNGVNTLLKALYYLLGHGMKQFIESAYFIDKFRKFLTIENSIVSGKKDLPTRMMTIELRDVSFSYDNRSEILHGINLKISKGEKIALVGLNGEGKTTLIKLIMRLYDPTCGEILLNGVNIKEYDLKDYRKRISCVFQNFQMYATTLGCNVSGELNVESEKVKRLMKQCGLEKWLDKMEYGLETELSQEFDEHGTDLSGGEKQKVALARALYQNPELMILDEPSSALDPISEQQFNHSVMKMSDNIMTIFVSHRLSTTVSADCIYVLSGGMISEYGTHKHLLQTGGMYAKMWECQAERYIHK